MTSSLEELLAEEGFKGNRHAMRPTRSSLRLESVSMPLNRQRDYGSTSGVKIRTERTRSDVSRYNLRVDSPASDEVIGRRQKGNLVTMNEPDEGSNKGTRGPFKGRLSRYGEQAKRSSDDGVKNVPQSEIVEVGEDEDDQFKDIFSDKVYSSDIRKDKDVSGNNNKVDKWISQSASNNLYGHSRFSNGSCHDMKEPGTSRYASHKNSFNSKSTEDKRILRRQSNTGAVTEPALDEVAVQAMISILTGYIKLFKKDDAFRVFLRDSCFLSLGVVESEEGNSTEGKIISNLTQAIKTVERAVKESPNTKDLKKAVLQLNMMTGLNSNDMKDGFTYGVPNYKLSACAHMYLSVAYKLQNKDRLSAKHLLQVFCDSPFQARTALLPELWEHLFFPHMVHLKEWYNQESEGLRDTPSRPRKLELIEKVYNEILTSGTYQFAVYYKDWLTGGVENNLIPSIHIPSASAKGMQQGGSYCNSSEKTSPVGPFSPQPMVSKKLYDAVFSHADKLGVEDVEDDDEDEKYGSCMRTLDASFVEDKEAVTDSAVIRTNENMYIKNSHDIASHMEDEMPLPLEDTEKLDEISASGESDLNDEVGDACIWKEATRRSHVLHGTPHTTADELILKNSTKSNFKPHVTGTSINHSAAPSLNSIETVKIESCSGGDYCDKEVISSSFLRKLICPLTEHLFEDPVTLETGQTFERAAIENWFAKGNTTCPVTSKPLKCLDIPLTNFVMRQIIDSWKSDFASGRSENSVEDESRIEDITAVGILRQLLTGFSEEEKIMNAKHLISLGGLRFFIHRFERGTMEERTHVAAILSCCIEADPCCRYQIARNVKHQHLLDLLYSKNVMARTNAVLLLTELNR